MRTNSQLEASRTNGARSQGPITSAGKARSSRNSFKTGIYAATEIVAGEKPEDLEALTAAYRDKYLPDGPDEAFLIDTIVRCHWMHDRLSRAEAQFWGAGICADNSALAVDFPLAAAARKVDASFERLQRRITATQRNWERSLKLLKSLQEDRRQAEPVPVEPVTVEPVPVEPAPDESLRFVPSQIPQPATNESIALQVLPQSASLSTTPDPTIAASPKEKSA